MSNHGLSRRTFLGTVAAVPLAARFAKVTSPPRVAVVGAGAFGGWTALCLRHLGAEVVLIDAWGPGNPRSSSGGDTRVIRAIYGPDRIYSEMVKHAFEMWKKLDASSDQPLYAETGALWMHRGEDPYLRSALPILEDLGFPLEKLTMDQARRQYPQIDFRGIKSIWFESRAGVLSAARACDAVRDAFLRTGAIYRTARVKSPIVNGSMPALALEDGSRIEADVYLFACGPWLGRLFPEVLGDWIRPTRQEVHYFGTPRKSERYSVGHLPVWIDFGERIVYGIPAAPGRAFKVADDTRGDPADPNANRAPSKEGVRRARRFLAERFPELARAPLRATHVCLYENSPDGHLIIDRHPQANNVWLVGGGSGHGFKLGPAVGEMVAEAILSGKDVPKMFRLQRLRDATKRSTQFETRQ